MAVSFNVSYDQLVIPVSSSRSATRYSTGGCSIEAIPRDVEIRGLTCYETTYGFAGAQ